MTTAIIIADTHGYAPKEILSEIDRADKLIFAGDGYTALYNWLSEDNRRKLIGVAGNCDYDCGAPTVATFRIEDVNIYLTHGHLHRVKYHYYGLLSAAQQERCSIAIYGHTHSEDNTTIDGVTLFNPASYRYCGSYGYLTVDGSDYSLRTIELP